MTFLFFKSFNINILLLYVSGGLTAVYNISFFFAHSRFFSNGKPWYVLRTHRSSQLIRKLGMFIS